ncbi:hypothetical protein DFQ27_006487 [Actinomortierella ambigua]|uniref:Uncharacterized protein n=1 Tax=Actinomortierella ambigua TaxID=1343610 RepID=A0A9P6PYV6_9FUNG|nr:hypothetical protein DFQ26_003020 [Actinomortierella ambigua]KAG0255035.1 hypothetical protein DFQ27_006487 [Actinomortierella ambigua]
MTTSPPDPVFEELSSIPGHLASFSASLASGDLLHVNGDFNQEQARLAQKLMQDAGQLVSRYVRSTATPSSLPTLHPEESLVRKVTLVTSDGSSIALTMADNKIYGVERE